MTTDPDETDGMGGIEVVEFLDEVEVFDFAGGFFPITTFPGGGPFS